MDNNDKQTGTVVLITPSSVVQALNPEVQKDKKNRVTWVYIGKSYQIKKQCREVIGTAASEVDICHDLDVIINGSENDYISLMERLNDANSDNLAWWFSPVSTRCPLLTDFFLNICYYRLVEKMCDNNRVPSVIIVESTDLLGILNKVLADRGFSISSPLKSGETKPGGTYFRSVRRVADFFNPFQISHIIRQSVLPSVFNTYRFIVRAYHRRLSAYKTRRSDPLGNLKKTVLVVTYFLQNSMTEGRFIDRYHPYLYEYLKGKGFDLLIYPRFYEDNASLKVYDDIRRNEDRILIPEDYLSISDYVYGLLYCFHKKRRVKIEINQDDPYYILQDLIRKEIENGSILEILAGYLTYRASRNILEKGKNIRSIILWNENQYDDRGIIRAARTVCPDTPIMGFRGYIHITNYCNILPLESEARAGLTPTRFLITGASQKDFITKYSNSQRFSIAAALRYNHIFLEKKYDLADTTMHPRECIVIILPGMEQALEIIDKVYSSMQEGHLVLPCYVKDHPNCPFKSVESDGMKGFFIPYTGTIDELPLMYPIIISGTTSTIIETLCMGIPSIFLSRENSINFDLITDEVTHYYRLCSRNELITTIKEIMNRDKTEYDEIIQASRKIQEDFFTPINEETMRPFIEDIADKS